MSDMKQTNIQKHATEKAILMEKVTAVKNKADAMQKSLDNYLTSYYISTNDVPKSLDSINIVLKRFFTEKKISDLNDLVANHPNLLGEAIQFVKNPATNDNRAAYNEAESTLKIIKSNLEEYKKLDTYTEKNARGTKEMVSNHDGFKLFVEKAKLIHDFKGEYDGLVTYAKGSGLNPDNLPKTVEALKSNVLMIGDTKGVQGSAPKQNIEAQLPEEGERFEVGSEKDLALFNKNILDGITNDITNRKLACYKTPILNRMEYNKCAIEHMENSDLKCSTINNRYEISKANCESHFPMVTISDAVMSKVFNDIEKGADASVKDGVYSVDYSNGMFAAGDYMQVLNLINKAAPKQLADTKTFDTGAAKTKKIVEELPEAFKKLGYDAGMLLAANKEESTRASSASASSSDDIHEQTLVQENSSGHEDL